MRRMNRRRKRVCVHGTWWTPAASLPPKSPLWAGDQGFFDSGVSSWTTATVGIYRLDARRPVPSFGLRLSPHSQRLVPLHLILHVPELMYLDLAIREYRPDMERAAHRFDIAAES